MKLKLIPNESLRHIFPLGMKNLTNQFDGVFKYLFAKKTSKEAFIFTDKVYSNSIDGMSCLERGFQYCQSENIRSVLQAYLKNIPKDWSPRKNQVRRAAVMVWLAMHIEISRDQYAAMADDVLDLIYELVENGKKDIEHVNHFFQTLPPLKYLGFWKQNTAEYPLCSRSNNIQSRCVFAEILAIFSQYEQFINREVKSKFVRTDIKWEEYFNKLKWNEIKDQSTTMMLEIKKHIDEASTEIMNFLGKNTATRFNTLGKQMKRMATFGRKKSLADVGYIADKLAFFKKAVEKYMGNVKRKMVPVLQRAFETTAIDVAIKSARLTLSMIGMFNPIKYLIGE